MDLSQINQKLKNLKKEHGQRELLEKSVKADPFLQFIDWFNQELEAAPNDYDPSVMVLATIDENNLPDARVVLLKELADSSFIFYTNYQSSKAEQLLKNNVAALDFYWPHSSRQVRIRGQVKKIPRKQSEAYFATRPRDTQLGAAAWVQSSVLSSKEEMEKKLQKVSEKYADKPIPCPENWGGFSVSPFEYEFFQGRSWRMHDRLFYMLDKNEWTISRLAP